ncbi:MAG TPA: hypothetical protein VK186_05865, partial [Candidatus Deferrimicrobium sp.]|nr:hypothetical protein [Candidatus Deferrimicrobium sp.]
RFNIAASHYNSPHILELIGLSARLFPAVAVEIPSIPADYEKLVRVLPILAEKQVKYLNLHEYILMPGDPASSSLPAATFILDKKDKITFATQSMANTEKIIRFCHDHAIGLTINNCSLSHKEHQMCQRHVVMADILKKEYEKPTSCGYLETYLVHPRVSTGAALQELMKVAKGFPLSQLEPFLVHPDQYRNSPLRTKALRLTFISPLGIDSPRRLFRIEEIRKN